MRQDLNVGDSVYVDGYTSMAQQNAGLEKIEGVDYKFDVNTGERFTIYLVNGCWFDSRDGGCFSNPNSMYYLEDNE
jgi:hypothetical protein